MSIPDDPPSRELLEFGRRDLERRFDLALDLTRYQTKLGTRPARQPVVRPLSAPGRQLGHEAPAVLWRDGQETVLSIYNYRGPAKVFWEYRTLSGPFFKGNVLSRRSYSRVRPVAPSPKAMRRRLPATSSERDVASRAARKSAREPWSRRGATLMQPLVPVHRRHRGE